MVAGYIEPHDRPDTKKLETGLEHIPRKVVQSGAIRLEEFDLDAALNRHPTLILVDELAHTNAKGSRHHKRFKDIEELLNAGIDVYTTVNVQHIESLRDLVASITGVQVQERIPDSVFDSADLVTLVDIEPEELLDRLSRGEVYHKDQAERAQNNFFKLSHLQALREIALRRCADRVNEMAELAHAGENEGGYMTDESILVCLSSSPSNPKIIRTAARMAKAFKGTLTALYVEPDSADELDEEDAKRLRENVRLAQQLGANIETVPGDDIATEIAEYARLTGVSKIVLGRSEVAKPWKIARPTLTEKLIEKAPEIDIHIIPDSEGAASDYHKKRVKASRKKKSALPNIAKTALILIGAYILGYVFDRAGFTESNIMTIFLLAVLLVAFTTGSIACSLGASVIAIVLFDYYFTEPKFLFTAYTTGYPVSFAVMVIASVITSLVMTRVRRQAVQNAQSAVRTRVLLETDQLLARAKTPRDVFEIMAGQLEKLLGKSIIVYPKNGEKLDAPRVFPYEGGESEESWTSENEKAVAQWVFKNNKHAGATTDTLSESACLYLSIRVNDASYGVAGIVMDRELPDAFENSVTLSILGESALALENLTNEQEKKEAFVLAENEKLRANLLRTISHDLRSPLTAIEGNAETLMDNAENLNEETKHEMYSDIYQDASWLTEVTENLLSITKLDDGSMHLNCSVELAEDIAEEAVSRVHKNRHPQKLALNLPEKLLFVRSDSRLIVQVLVNLIDNAYKYTPDDAEIEVKVEEDGDRIRFSVSDTGKGLTEEVREHIFERFYTGPQKVADSRRSLGLGLSLCQSILQAHGSEIQVTSNFPTGCVFSFELKKQDANLK